MFTPRKLGILVCTAIMAGNVGVAASTAATASTASTAATASADSDRAQAAKCSKNNSVPFTPVKVSIAKIGNIKIVGRGRTLTGVPKAPPLTDSGKRKIAWDRGGVKPGSLVRHVLFNAHVWTDGSAVGDQFNTSLKRKSIIKVRGAQGQIQCYQVTKQKIGRNGKRLAKLYYGNTASKPMLAIVTCAGVRLGPGNWSKRSVWLAKPLV